MDAILFAIIMIPLALGMSVLSSLIAKMSMQRANIRYANAIERIVAGQSNIKDRYFVYGAFIERNAERRMNIVILLFTGLGFFFYTIAIVAASDGSISNNDIIFILECGTFFILAIPLMISISILTLSNKVVMVTRRGIELWRFNRKYIQMEKSIDWSGVKSASISVPRYSSMFGGNMFTLALRFNPSGWMTMDDYYFNMASFLRDLLQFAPNIRDDDRADIRARLKDMVDKRGARAGDDPDVKTAR
jgi:hypothetical protein